MRGGPGAPGERAASTARPDAIPAVAVGVWVGGPTRHPSRPCLLDQPRQARPPSASRRSDEAAPPPRFCPVSGRRPAWPGASAPRGRRNRRARPTRPTPSNSAQIRREDGFRGGPRGHEGRVQPSPEPADGASVGSTARSSLPFAVSGRAPSTDDVAGTMPAGEPRPVRTPQLTGRQRASSSFFPGHDIGYQVLLADRIFLGQDRRFTHRREPRASAASISAELDPEAADLTWGRAGRETRRRRRGRTARGRPCGTGGRPVARERVGHEALGRQIGPAEIAAGHADPADVELTRHPDGHGRQVRVEHVDGCWRSAGRSAPSQRRSAVARPERRRPTPRSGRTGCATRRPATARSTAATSRPGPRRRR